MKLPRILLTASSSGSGKTMITCGLLQILKERGTRTASFKCGPDYIDPMFHRAVLGIPSRNLDTFFTDEETTRYLLEKGGQGADLALIEGVMGYYDGLGALSDRASAWDVSRVTRTPSILIVNCRGMSLSILPIIQGFLRFRPDSGICGVILNRISGMLYPRMKEQIESLLPVRVLGYVPETDVFRLESRHLGLVMPSEMEDIRGQLRELAALLGKTLDVEGILRLADQAPEITGRKPAVPHFEGEPVIAVAMDQAFCFYYEDNLDFLRQCGAVLKTFSPLEEDQVPEADGLLLGGGYPELHLARLSANVSMRQSVREKVTGGLPTLAECGGFMYLLEEMEDMEGQSYPVAGALSGRAFRTRHLQRFGYIELESQRDQMLGDGAIRGHEFHYFDATDNGDAYRAKKPLSDRGWACIRANGTLAAGFPHLYYYANPKKAARFVRSCAAHQQKRREGGT